MQTKHSIDNLIKFCEETRDNLAIEYCEHVDFVDISASEAMKTYHQIAKTLKEHKLVKTAYDNLKKTVVIDPGIGVRAE